MSKKYQILKDNEPAKIPSLLDVFSLQRACKIQPTKALGKTLLLDSLITKLQTTARLSKVHKLHKTRRISKNKIMLKLQKLQKISLGSVTLNTMITLQSTSVKLKKR